MLVLVETSCLVQDAQVSVWLASELVFCDRITVDVSSVGGTFHSMVLAINFADTRAEDDYLRQLRSTISPLSIRTFLDAHALLGIVVEWPDMFLPLVSCKFTDSLSAGIPLLVSTDKTNHSLLAMQEVSSVCDAAKAPQGNSNSA